MRAELSNEGRAELEAEAREILEAEARALCVRFYLCGFVPNSYKWPAPGEALEVHRQFATMVDYDRKRTHGRGPRRVVFTKAGGTLRGYTQ